MKFLLRLCCCLKLIVENDELRVRVRRLMQPINSMPSSVISSHSMHVGVLATASHAITTGTLFSVFYKPRTSRSEFIVSVNKYLEAKNHKVSVGLRFKMRFEGDETPERSFSGTIIGLDKAPSRWADSEWRSLKVQWDEPSSIPRPDRVSPWGLETPLTATPPTSQPVVRNKRDCWHHLILLQHLVYGNHLPRILKLSHSQGRIVKEIHTQSCPIPLFTSASKPCLIEPSSANSPMYWSTTTINRIDSFLSGGNDEHSERKQESRSGCRLFGVQLVESSVEEISVPTGISSVREEQPVMSLDAELDQHYHPANFNRSDLYTAASLRSLA